MAKINASDVLDGTYDRKKFGKDKATMVVLKARAIAYALSAVKMGVGSADFNPPSDKARDDIVKSTYMIVGAIIPNERSVEKFMRFAHKKNPFQRAVYDFWVLELLNISFKTDDLPLMSKVVDKILADLAISGKHFLSI